MNWKYIQITQKIGSDQFYIHRIIGRGGFGEVYGCHKLDTGKMFAIKCMYKKRIKLKKGEKLALNERKILGMINCPFIVCMHYAFQNEGTLFFVLDLMDGGDLHYHLVTRGCFTESEVRFYTCEIILALEYLHNAKIAYRDLKPSNVLMNSQGFSKISDLGLACDCSSGKLRSCLGTVGYMAPELIERKHYYDHRVDHFSLGCLIVKLLTGSTPFTVDGHDMPKVKELTLNSVYELPDKFSWEARSLVDGFLKKSPDERLGGSKELNPRDHPFFRHIQWSDVISRKIPPPVKPPNNEVNAGDAHSIGSFSDEEMRKIKLESADQLLYNDFDFKHPELWQDEICETIFNPINSEYTKNEVKKYSQYLAFKEKLKDSPDWICYGCISRFSALFVGSWNKRFAILFPNRLEILYSGDLSAKTVITIDQMIDIEKITYKNHLCIRIKRINHKSLIFRCDSPHEIEWWHEKIVNTHKIGVQLLAVYKIGGGSGSSESLVAGRANRASLLEAYGTIKKMTRTKETKLEEDSNSVG